MLNKKYETILVEQQPDGITWIKFNRPAKRNAMSPKFHEEMADSLTRLNGDNDTKLVILAGEGGTFCAGQDLKEFFRGLEGKPYEQSVALQNSKWRNEILYFYNKPTIAMIEGYCVGGGFTQAICTDFAIAADDAVFSLSEVNWGILPGGMVAKVVSDCIRPRDAMLYACTGRSFDGKEAARIGLINFSVPKAKLKEETLKLAAELLTKNQNALRATKHCMRAVRDMDWRESEHYLAAKMLEIKYFDSLAGHNGGAEGIKRFIDEKSYKPVLGSYTQAKAATKA